jgi:GNAT superfamily N-acetyltransferase
VTAPLIRAAEADDLEPVWDFHYANEVAGESHPPARVPVPPYLPHLLESGQLLVAEHDGRLLGFAGLVRRGSTAFLTDLHVRLDRQSSAIGRSLLHRILPTDGTALLTLSSTDPRALALYARAGMRPRWPNLLLEVETGRIGALPINGIEVVEADPADRSLAAWDADGCGRPRPMDIEYWLGAERGVPLWFSRNGKIVGYGIVRFAAGQIWHPEAVTVGPVGVRDAGVAAACVVAAVRWARERGSFLELAVPGPHPALAPLLEAKLRIAYVETYCASEPNLVDPERYVGSGGDLF